ncbi:hypothetical protein ACKWRH_24955 [Bradyrhizobium sp. Pa8]|uniref:hypothetical protein n=1 Tax=Bradyrhizobium sp. Pa8 TaxID=3386552 RepID=UPI00403F32ED
MTDIKMAQTPPTPTEAARTLVARMSDKSPEAVGMSDVMELIEVTPDKPPAPVAPVVLAHRKRLEIERDALRTGAAELALRSARGDKIAQTELAAIPVRQAALQFEIDLNHDAHDLAVQQDAAAEVAWRASLQSMDPEVLIEGIGRDRCCNRCMPGLSCVITAGYPYAAATCGHPVREKQTIFGRDANGNRQFLYAQNPQAARVFEAARKKLNVPTR